MLYVPLAAMGLFSSKVLDGEWQAGSAAVKSEARSLTKVFASAKYGEEIKYERDFKQRVKYKQHLIKITGINI